MSRPAWINVGGQDSVGSATVTASSNTLTVTSHGLVNGDIVMVDSLTGGADGPLIEGAVYFVRNVNGDDFQLSGTRGSQIKEFASDGTAEVYVAVPSYNAQALRLNDTVTLFHGSSDALGAREGVRPGISQVISVSGNDWTVHNHSGVVYPGITSTSGPYRYHQLATSDTLDPADGTNDRIDALDLLIEDDDEDASGFRRSRVVYVAGTPAGSPSPEPVTPNASRLGTILVPSGGSPSPSVVTQAQFTVASGGILPVSDSTDLPVAGLYDGMTAWNLDVRSMVVRDNGNWQEVSGPPSVRRVGRTSNQSIPNNSDTAITFQTPSESFIAGISPFTISGTQAVIARDGVYAIYGSVAWEGDSSSWRRVSILHHPGGGSGTIIAQSSTSFDTSGISQGNPPASTVYAASAGDEFSMTCRHNVGSSLNVLADPRTFFAMVRIGSL